MGIFLETDAQTIYDDVITKLQEGCGEVLPEGDERRIFADAMTAYLLAVLTDCEDVAKQKMLAYARGEALDAIGEMYGCERTAGSPATVTLEFTLDEARPQVTYIPAGTVAATPTGVQFSTDAQVAVPAGETTATASATADWEGTDGNGLVAGSTFIMLSSVAHVASVTNTTTSSGGVDAEEDDEDGNARYRARIRLAQQAVSTCGTRAAYEYYAKLAVPSIADVSVPEPATANRVAVYVVGEGGTQLTSAELATLLAAVSADDVRPLGDVVSVHNATRVGYDITVSYTCDAQDEAAVVEAIEGAGGAIEAYEEWQDETIGRDIAPQKLMALLFAAGAETINVTSPVAGSISETQVAKAGTVTVTHQAV